MTITRWTITQPPADGRHQNWGVSQEVLLSPEAAWSMAASLCDDRLYQCAAPYQRQAHENTCAWDWVEHNAFPSPVPFLSQKARAKFDQKRGKQVILTCEY